jgi:putative ABC transport system substrate-binding protein
MRRREFITFLGGAAAAWPVAARAQQPERMRRIGVLMHTKPDEPQAQARVAALSQRLQELGWTVGRNLQIDTRWNLHDNGVVGLRKEAAELIALGPDVVFAGVGPTAEALRQVTKTVPIVFGQGVDPVGSGLVKSLARPGVNVTGFLQFEYSLSGKWIELLKELAPRVTRVGVLRESGAAGIGQWAVIQTAASPLGIELSTIGLESPGEIERAVSEFAQDSNSGLIVAVSARSQIHSELIVTLAARHRLPVAYPYRFFVASGGLISYGPDLIGQYRRAAGYIDRVLKGEKPADLPVQAPTKYEMAINLKTAKALGITVSPSLLARADEVME